MTELLAVLGLAVLFVVFGMGAGRTARGGCACGDAAERCGSCPLGGPEDGVSRP